MRDRRMDVVYVTYNSERWIDRNLQSWLRSDYDLKQIFLYFVDNRSTDSTWEKLAECKEQCGSRFGAFEVIREKKNWGFGKANNIGFSKGSSDIVCFFNIDTELFPDTMKNLSREIEETEEATVLWELRQFPYEHPKLYDPLTGETSWSSGAAFAVRREIYAKIGGFDESIFLYAEDVDLSWRLRSFGYRLQYVPKATITHYSYESAGQVKPNQYIYSIVNNLLLRYRFGNWAAIVDGNAKAIKCILGPVAFPHSRHVLLQAYLSHIKKIPHFLKKSAVGKSPEFHPTFLGFDYAPIRDGAFYQNEYPNERPLVSVIVRTCGRPSVLRETLISLRKQTYPNLEIVVVEDGEAVSEQMIRAEFADLNILYRASGVKVGRSRAGNMAMEMAHGTYLNFLDDDDLFYADHVEVLVRTLEQSDCRAAYAFGFETPIEVKSKEPYIYEVKNYYGVHKQAYNKIELCYHNFIPIQCIMFERSLYQEYGGLDESVDALEDWDLWVRYSLHTDFACVQKTTSIYRVPYNKQNNAKRQKELDDALQVMRDKHKNYRQTLSVYEIAILYEKFH